tara:strand:+ start:366597 stop:367574 length:978 start_codon:yes stop_codon:yes gene_type:complete
MLELGLFWIGIALIVISIFMLFTHSFQSKKVWAIVSLILVVPLLIHMVFNWSSLHVRKAFYIQVIGLLAVMVSVSGGALSKLTFLQDNEVLHVVEDKIAPPQNTPLPNQQQADSAAKNVEKNYDPLLTGSEYEQLDAKEIVPETPNQVVRTAEPSARYVLVTDDERIHVVNKRVRVTMTDGRVVEGMLTGLADDSLIVESEVSGGSLGLSYQNDQIQSLAVRLIEGETLRVPPEIESESAEELETEHQEGGTIPEGDPLQPQDGPAVDESEVSVIDGIAEQRPVLENSQSLPKSVSEAPAVENETLKKVEEIVDETKLLNNINEQ